MLFFVLLSLIILISYAIIGFKIILAIKNREKKRLRKLLIVLTALILFSGFFWRLLPGSDVLWYPIDQYRERTLNKNMTGLEFNDGGEVLKFESDVAFNGDGYSFYIHEIDQETADYFKKPKAAFFTKYPLAGERDDWKTEHWKRTPIDSSEMQYFNQAKRRLPKINTELEKLLNEKGNYYAYTFFEHEFNDSTINILNVYFYIIGPKRRLIVEMYLNT
ncbi:MAG: hypothetical protein ACJAXI_001540 [Crocinitomicaceae bacterium]|jgi:hypothetical protein